MSFRFWRPGRDLWRVWVLEAIKPGAICAEVGVWKGDFSAQILRYCNPSELHLIDPWEFKRRFPNRWYGGALARNQSDMDNIFEEVVSRFRRSDTVKIHRLPSLFAAGQFEDGKFDWIYIDGDHSTQAVEADIYAWLPKLKPGGALFGDDYEWTDENGTRSVATGVERACTTLSLKPERIAGGQYLIRP